MLPETCYHYRFHIYEVDPVMECEICHQEIYEGDIYYDVKGLIMCTECISDCEREAEI